MARILSHPFRLVGDAVATVDQDSDDGYAEQLIVMLTTKRGERILVPSFGIADPVFQGIDIAEVRLGVALYGPPVIVHEVRTRVTSDVDQEVEVTYGQS